MNQNDKQDPRVKIVSAPEAVPVFNCVVHFGHNDDGTVTARIANLKTDAFVAENEISALKRAVQDFKKLLAESCATGEKPPLIEPSALNSGEESRLIAVHL